VRAMNIPSMSAARKLVRDAQAKEREERVQREKDNVEDMASFLLSRDRLAGVDAWEAERVAQVGSEAAQRRDEHRNAAAVAVARMRARGEAVGAIARLAGAPETEVRSYLKLANSRASANDTNGADGASAAGSAPVSDSLGAPVGDIGSDTSPSSR
jgi:hypothetical protein